MDRALAQPISDLERIETELAALCPPQETKLYRCHNTACRWEGDAALGIWNDLRKTDEVHCPVEGCGRWICDGVPLKHAERRIKGSAEHFSAPQIEVTHGELIEQGYTIDQEDSQ